MAKYDAAHLSRMPDAEYKRLTPEMLMMYNKEFPTIDYENPYSHQEYPRAMYRLIRLENGQGRLQVAKVNNALEQASLGPGWAKTPKELGIETAPAAPPITIDDTIEITIPGGPEPTPVAHLSELGTVEPTPGNPPQPRVTTEEVAKAVAAKIATHKPASGHKKPKPHPK